MTLATLNYSPDDAPMPVSSELLIAHLANLRLRNLSINTLRERRNALLRLERHLSLHLSQIGPADLDRWQHEIVHLSPRYRASWQSHARAFFRWAHQNEHLPTDPSRVLVRVKVPRGLPHPIGAEDLFMAINCAPGRIRPWLILAAFCGLRAAEIADLTRADIQTEPPLLIVNGKGGRQRIVPMSRLVVDELSAYGLPSRGHLFRRADGKAGGNQPWQVSHLANGYLHGLGISESLHSLRHYFGTETYRECNDLRVTQELLGHESPTTTAVYTAFSNTAGALAVQLVADKARLMPSRYQPVWV